MAAESMKEMERYISLMRADCAVHHAISATVVTKYKQKDEFLVWKKSQVSSQIGKRAEFNFLERDAHVT